MFAGKFDLFGLSCVKIDDLKIGVLASCDDKSPIFVDSKGFYGG